MQGRSEVRPVAVGTRGGQLPVGGDGLALREQRVVRTAKLREPGSKAVQAPCEAGTVTPRVAGRQLPVGSDDFLGDG